MRENLKAARMSKDMTQQQVADYLGMTLRNYQKIEAGDIVGKITHWDALEDLFSIHQRKLRDKSQEDTQQRLQRS